MDVPPTTTPSSGKYCFEPADFAAETFDPATFVTAAKEVTSLEALRAQLQDHQRDLREELYQVINRDLADYLNLSSRLSGVEAEVLEIRAPLAEMATHLGEARDFAAAKRQALQAQLQARAGLQGRRAVLEKRIHFLGTLAEAEVLLGMPGAGWTSDRHRKKKVPLREVGEAMDAADLTSHCAALERLAQAWLVLMSDLACFPANDEEDDVPTSAAMGLRLLRVEKALLQHLSAVLRTVICPKNLVISLGTPSEIESGRPKGSPKSQEQDQPPQINVDALRKCLRSFIVLGRGDEAEKQTARLLMLPFIDLNFTQGRLDGGSRGSCSGLAGIYAACIGHVQRNLGQALLVAEACATDAGGPGAAAAAGAMTAAAPPPALDMVCNGVWRPIHQALCSRLASIFAPGIASILHTNYVISMAFLQDLATLVGPGHEAALRRRIQAHASTKDFEGRWNLPVYFHLRFTEVSAKIDQALANLAGQGPVVPAEERGNNGAASPTSTTPTAGTASADLVVFKKDVVSAQFSNPIFATVWHALLGLWEPDVFLPPLTPRLFKLTLQIIRRFHLWVEEDVGKMEQQQQAPTRAAGTQSRPLMCSDTPDALVNVSWDAWLFCHDTARTHLEQHILQAVHRDGDKAAAAAAAATVAGLHDVVREGLAEALQPFEGLVERGWRALHTHVVAQCVTVLQAVRGITATYRMTNKRPPERASPFVAKVLDPLRTLEPDVAGKVPPFALQPPGWKADIVAAVLVHYLEATRELLNSVEQMEDALKKRKQRTAVHKGPAASEGGGVGGGGGGGGGGDPAATLSDSDKIRLQLLLDVAAFAEDMHKVGGIQDPLADNTYVELLQVVAPARQFMLQQQGPSAVALSPLVHRFFS